MCDKVLFTIIRFTKKLLPFSGCPSSREIVKGTLPRVVPGSMTVETSIVLPLFLIFFINVSSSIEMIRLHSNISMALWNVGSDLGFYGALLTEPVRTMGKTGHRADADEGKAEDSEDKLNENEQNIGKIIVQELGDIAVSYMYVKNRLIDYLGSDYLENSPIKGGTEGLCFLESEIFNDEDIMDIGVTYSVSPPIDLGGPLSFRMSNRYYAHLWNGYNVGGSDKKEDKGEIVYITKDSEVYHTRTDCTYLKLSVRSSTMSALPEERNQSGGTYGRCLICAVGDPPDVIYICDEGGKYHYSRECYSLMRSYTAVSLESVRNTHRPCSRCGGFHGSAELDTGYFAGKFNYRDVCA